METAQFTTYNAEASIPADLDTHEKLIIFFDSVLFKQCSCNTFSGTALKIMNAGLTLYPALLLLPLFGTVIFLNTLTRVSVVYKMSVLS